MFHLSFPAGCCHEDKQQHPKLKEPWGMQFAGYLKSLFQTCAGKARLNTLEIQESQFPSLSLMSKLLLGYSKKDMECVVLIGTFGFLDKNGEKAWNPFYREIILSISHDSWI